MANIFALQGSSNSGKSSTLIQLLTDIITKYPSATTQYFYRTGDIKVILSGINGLIVGLESQGDPHSRLQQSLSDFRTAGCDIIFCACRTRGMTVNWIKAMSPPDRIQFIHQARTSTQAGQQAANTAMSSRLMHLAGI